MILGDLNLAKKSLLPTPSMFLYGGTRAAIYAIYAHVVEPRPAPSAHHLQHPAAGGGGLTHGRAPTSAPDDSGVGGDVWTGSSGVNGVGGGGGGGLLCSLALRRSPCGLCSLLLNKE